MKIKCKDGKFRRFLLPRHTPTKWSKCLECNLDFQPQETDFDNKKLFKEHVCLKITECSVISDLSKEDML